MSLIEIKPDSDPGNPHTEIAEIQKREALSVISEIALTGTSKLWGEIIEKHSLFSGDQSSELTGQQIADRDGYARVFSEAFGPLYGQTILTFWEIRKPVREGKVSFELVARTREARQARIIAETLGDTGSGSGLRVSGLNPETGILVRFPGSRRGL